jgi:hypothetical protein
VGDMLLGGIVFGGVAGVGVWIAFRRSLKEWEDSSGPPMRRPGGSFLPGRAAGGPVVRRGPAPFPKRVAIQRARGVVPAAVPALQLGRPAAADRAGTGEVGLPTPAGVDDNGLLRPPVEAQPENERGGNQA